MKALLGILLALSMAVPAFGVGPDEVLPDPALEARARAISAGLRCLVCQNQSIDDSDAPLARDLRVILRERIAAGDTDDEAVNHIVARYGEYVLLRPVFAWHTLLLWAAAPLLLLVGVFVLLSGGRRTGGAATTLGADEAAVLEQLRQDDRRPAQGPY